MQFKVYTDGGSLNNPGPAAIAYAIGNDDKIFIKHSERIGIATNNFAEYLGVVKALEKIKTILANRYTESPEKITFYSDSILLVNQLNGLYKVKNGRLREFIMKVRILEQEIKIPISYINIPREQNKLADSLVKQALR